MMLLPLSIGGPVCFWILTRRRHAPWGRKIVARQGGALIWRRGRREVSGVLVEELGRVLGDAGRLVDLGGVGALLVEERRGGELRRAEGRAGSGPAELSVRRARRDGDEVVAGDGRVGE